MHFQIPIADAVPGFGLVVAETPASAQAQIAALFAQLETIQPGIALADMSIAAVEGGRLFAVAATFTAQLAGPARPAVSSLFARIFRGETLAEIAASRVAAYAVAPIDPFAHLRLDKVAATSNGREFWNLQLFEQRMPG